MVVCINRGTSSKFYQTFCVDVNILGTGFLSLTLGGPTKLLIRPLRLIQRGIPRDTKKAKDFAILGPGLNYLRLIVGLISKCPPQGWGRDVGGTILGPFR